MKVFLSAILFVFMTLAVPWFFTTDGNTTAVESAPGLPGWVVYVTGAAVCYATFVAVLIHFFWDTSASESGDVSSEQGGTGK